MSFALATTILSPSTLMEAPTLLQQWQEAHSVRITVFLLTLLFSMITFFFFFFFALSRSKLNLPPQPPKLPFLGNLHQLGSLPHRSMHALARKHGPLMLLHIGAVPTVVISSAQLAQEVMKTHDLIFASRPPSSMANRLMYGSRDISFSSYGEYWRQVRRISVLHLLSFKRVRSFRTVREEEVSLMLEKIRASSSGLVCLSATIINLTNDIVCRVALGRKYSGSDGSRSSRFHELLAEFLKLLGTFPLKDFVPCIGWVDWLSGLDDRVKKNFEALDSFLENVLNDHIHNKKNNAVNDAEEDKDLVDILLSLNPIDSEGILLDHDSIKAIILDMFAAGTDTVFTVLEWTMAELIRHPEIMANAQKEIREIAGQKAKIKEEDIGQMSYLKAVIKEVLRLHPPLPLLVPRESLGHVKLQSYDIVAKTRVLINVWAIGRDPSSWDRPEEFWPERFLNCDVDFRGQNFELLPFGAGRRACPGIMFAISTIELALANLLHQFDWKLPDGERAEELDMNESPGITVHKKTGLLLRAVTRYS